MSLFKRESLHQRLAREAGLQTDESPAVDTRPAPWSEVGIHGVARPRQWDAVATADAPQLGVGEVEFAVLPDGTLVVDDSLELEPGSLDPLAGALESTLQPPYKASAVWRGGSRWAVAGRRIDVVELPADVRGEEIVVSVSGHQRSFAVDGEPAFGSRPELERLGRERADSFVVRAERLADRFWEVEITPL